MLAIVTTAMVVAPMLSPVLGGGLTELFGWRAAFWCRRPCRRNYPMRVNG